MLHRLRALVTTSAFVTTAAIASAQAPQSVVWSIEGPGAPVRSGTSLTVTVTADVQPSWHLYSMTQPKGGPVGLEIRPAKGQPFEIEAAKISAPAPKTSRDENFQMETRYYDRKTSFTVPIAVAASAPAGPQTLAVEVRYQACSGTICLRPITEMLRVPVTIIR